MNFPATLPRRRQVGQFVARVDALIERANPVLVLSAIVAGAALMWGFYALQVTDWFVQTDELQSVRLAMTIAGDLSISPQIRGAAIDANNQLYPLLLAPLYGVLDTPAAFKVAHALNALLMASTAVPAYLLARELEVSRLGGYLVAALSVAVPWMAFADMLRAEALAYPAFTWAVLAMLRAVVRPSVQRDLLALAAIAVAFFVRTQFVSLAIAFGAVVVVHALLHPLVSPGTDGRARGVLESLKQAARAHWLLAAVGAVVLLAAAVKGLDGLLGSYAGTAAEGDLLPPGLAQNVWKHLAIVTVAAGVVPFALGFAWAGGSLVRPASRAAHAFALLTLITSAILCVQASSFVIRFAGPAAFDRYFFYLVPLALVAMAACILEGRRFWLLAAASGAVFLWLVRFGTFEPFPGPFHASPPGAFYTVLEFHAGRIDLSVAELARWAGIAAILVSALALRLLSPRLALAGIGVVLLVFNVAQTRSVFRSVEKDQVGSPIGHPKNPDWIDDVVPADADVALLPSLVTAGRAEHPVDLFASERLWWDMEFWNKRVSDAYVMVTDTSADATPFSKRWGIPRADRRVLELQGIAPTEQAPYLLVDPRRADLRLAGRVVATSPSSQLQLIRAARPYRLDYLITGLLRGGWLTPGQPATMTSWGRTSRTVTLQLIAPPETPKPLRYSLRTAQDTRHGFVPRTGAGPALVRVCLPAGRARVQIRAEGVTEVLNLGPVGVRIGGVTITPRPGGC